MISLTTQGGGAKKAEAAPSPQAKAPSPGGASKAAAAAAAAAESMSLMDDDEEPVEPAIASQLEALRKVEEMEAEIAALQAQLEAKGKNKKQTEAQDRFDASTERMTQ